MTAREEILSRIRTALSDRPAPVDVPRAYRRADPVSVANSATVASAATVALFVERVADYRAEVTCVALDDLPSAIAAAITKLGINQLVVPDGVPAPLLAALPCPIVGDELPLTPAELERAGAVLTTCAVAIAETGTIVLDATAGQGRRVLTLIPDIHLVVVRSDQIVAGVPDAIARLDPVRPLTWISGPSATSDIELIRVEGVHGPRNLHVFVTS